MFTILTIACSYFLIVFGIVTQYRLVTYTPLQQTKFMRKQVLDTKFKYSFQIVTMIS